MIDGYDRTRASAGSSAEAEADQYVSTRPEWSVEEWRPSRRISILWNVLGLMLVVLGFIGFGVTAAVMSGGSVELAGLQSLPALVLMLVGTLLVHELIHGAAMLGYGARPRFGVVLIHRIMPVAYCTSPGFWFTRNQFVVVSLAPAVLMSVAGIALMPVGNLAGWLVIPLAINLGGSIGDLWFFGMLLRRPREMMVEDLREGMRFHSPPAFQT